MQAKEKIQQLIREAGKQVIGEDVEIHLEHPAQEEYGDYSANIAMALFANFKLQISNLKLNSPMELAEEIKKRISELEIGVLVEKIEVVKPGFINFYLSQKALQDELQEVLEKGEVYGSAKSGKGKTMLVDHSHPNIAKRFGIGHLRSTIIGQAIIYLYRFQGWNVIADNFLGDWGTQFGAMLAQIQNSKFKIQNEKDKIDLDVETLERMYVEFNQKAKDDPKLWDSARAWFKKLEDSDLIARSLWTQIKKTSMEEFERIWELLGVKFDHIHPESFFENITPSVLEDAKRAGVAVESEGALVVWIPGNDVPLMLQKSDGATTYEARDLAAIKFWKQEYKPERIVYEVGMEQSLHFEQVFKVAQMLGYVKEGQLKHVKHGLYLGTDGKKMRTRDGKTIKLEEVLDEAIDRAFKLASKGDALQSKELARAVGIGAVKYFDLLHQPETNIIFDWEKVMALEGNSAPYLQYTHARCQSILAKIENSNLKFQFKFKISNLKLNEEELALLRHLYKFSEVVEMAAQNYSPNLLCNFLFELAQRYNTLYNAHKIMGNPFRLALTQATGIILKSGLSLLGIQTPERM